MINCHLTGGGCEIFLILQTLSYTSARQETFCRVYLANGMWFSVVCTLVYNDTHHYNGQNIVDHEVHNIKDNERNLCQDLKTLTRT